MCIYINIYKTYRYAAYHTHSHEYVIRLNISHIQTALWIQFYHPKPLVNYITHSDCAGFWWLGVFTCQIKLVCCQCLKLIWSFSACVFKTASYYKKKAHSPNGEKKKKTRWEKQNNRQPWARARSMCCACRRCAAVIHHCPPVAFSVSTCIRH